MVMKSRSKIVFCLLAIALLGASTSERCFAEEGGSGASEGTAVERGGLPPLSSEDVSKHDSQSAPGTNGDAAKIPTGGAASEATHAAGQIDGIDTRVTVQPRRPGGRRDKVGNTVVKSIAPRNLLARRMAAPGALGPVVRDAIGVSVTHREGLEHFTIVVHGPATGAIGIAGGATGRVAKPEGSIAPAIPNANALVRPTVLNRGAINGTSLVRPGSSPSGVGGPAKTVAGINGTTIRSKH
jgi:hypothetical protein